MEQTRVFDLVVAALVGFGRGMPKIEFVAFWVRTGQRSSAFDGLVLDIAKGAESRKTLAVREGSTGQRPDDAAVTADTHRADGASGIDIQGFIPIRSVGALRHHL